MRGVDLIGRGLGIGPGVVRQIGRVGERRIAPADRPVLDRRETAAGLDGAAPVALGLGEGEGALVALIKARSLDAERALFEALHPFRAHQKALPAHHCGRENDVSPAARIDHRGKRQAVPGLLGIGIGRLGDAVQRLVAGVWQPKIGQPGYRNTQQFERRLLHGQRIVDRVGDNPLCLHRPADAASLGVDTLAARRIGGIDQQRLQRRIIVRAVGRDAGTIIGGDRHRIEESLFHPACQRQVIGLGQVPRRILDRHRADKTRVAGGAVIHQALPGQRIATAPEHHIA